MIRRRLVIWAAIAAGIALASALPATAGGAAGFTPPMQLGFAQGDDWEPAVAVDGSWVYAFWMHVGSNPPDCSAPASVHMVFQESADGGGTWAAPRSIACQAGAQADAQLSITRVGTVHRLYASWMDANQANTPIFVSWSDDFGATWSTPVNATRLDHGGSGGDKDILVTRGREVWVTYEHLTRNVVAHTPNIETTDFSQVTIPNPNSEVSLASGGGLDSQGNLYFTYGGVRQQGDANGPTDLWIARSADGGATWSTNIYEQSATAPSPSGSGWDYWGASAAFAIIPSAGRARPTDRLFVIYNAGNTPGGPQRIYTRYSDDQGNTWSARQDISGAPQGVWHGFPAAVADNAGVRVDWMDNRATASFPTCQTDAVGTCGTWKVWSSTSPNGVRFSAPTRIDGPAFVPLAPHGYQSPAGFMHPYGDYQWLALDSAGHTYAVWGEGPDYAGPGSVWFTRN